MFVTMGMSLLLQPSAFGHIWSAAQGHGSGGPLRLLRRQEPALDLRKDGTIRNGCGRGRPTLYKVHPGLHRIWSESFILPPNGKRAFESFETFLERITSRRAKADVGCPLPLDFPCIGR